MSPNLKFKESVAVTSGIRGHEGSSLLQEVVELSVFLSSAEIAFDRIGGFGYSFVDFGDFF